MFNLCLEILFYLNKNYANIKRIEIFEYCYLYRTYAKDTTLYLSHKNSIVHFSEKFRSISDFSGLKPNTTKWKIAWIGVLKEDQGAVCGMRCTDLRNEAIKVLGIYFLYNQKVKKCNTISIIQGVLNLWRMRMIVFKTLVISKIVFLALLIKIPYQVVKELEKIQNSFFWKNFTSKIRHETACKEYEDGGLKNVDIS